MLRVVPAVFLAFEGVTNAVWVAGLVRALQGHDGLVVVLVTARGLVGALQMAGGWLLLGDRLPAWTLAQAAFLASAVLTIFETGLRLVPSNADPTYRWQWTAVYWVYALGMIVLVRTLARRDPEADT